MAVARKATRAAQFEERTGQTENMMCMGWRCTGRGPDGVPSHYEKSIELGHANALPVPFVLVKTKRKGWIARKKLITMYGGGLLVSVVAPKFPGPVTLAAWLAVEISNGTLSFDT